MGKELKNGKNAIAGIVSLSFSLAALILMFMPTWRMEWTTDPSLVSETPVTDHRWFEPILLGYGNFSPIIMLVLTFIIVGMIVVAVLGKGYYKSVPIMGTVVFVLLMITGTNHNQSSYLTGAGYLVPVLIALATLIYFLAYLFQRRSSFVPS